MAVFFGAGRNREYVRGDEGIYGSGWKQVRDARELLGVTVM